MTISYDYDPLNRLTGADYSTGDSYAYTYDAAGNRLTQDSTVNGREPALSGAEGSSVTYGYDIANRLTTVNNVQSHTWDDNGNLLSDGVNSYTYDVANRLTAVSNQR